MRRLAGFLALLLSATIALAAPAEVPEPRIKQLVSAVNEASNRVMRAGSSARDVDALFNLYADDFVYVHSAYGGEYSRQLLYDNSMKNLEAGRYKLEGDRYTIVNMIVGLNAAAVERVESKSGKHHLSVFEFEGDKVSRITEYWK
ncbi:nuclear transport factor 2 family protein [Pseudomarimonas salicorniae]|uniref:Nuclear transport factor 2 family protein n=1 Tax=Pseudomarimonas salicorniae TaxID=2933270 RepID=A0ABT0GMM3_9GAMM|nr:nuclear transport factor 2 family protein [Lysobacter sp. CAU 1642]MCK7595622.1 nuclear transport factor 2 family protein [Lysobacter sp. CAU 1642]